MIQINPISPGVSELQKNMGGGGLHNVPTAEKRLCWLSFCSLDKIRYVKGL